MRNGDTRSDTRDQQEADDRRILQMPSCLSGKSFANIEHIGSTTPNTARMLEVD